MAEDLKAGNASPDEDEFLEIIEATFAETQQYIAEGRISDAKTILAAYIWQQKMAGDHANKGA
ncbi:hypothetical protein D3C79_1094310 [compost metagenome]